MASVVASPITLQFMDTVGGSTGSFLPTDKLVNTFDGIDVTCMDVAMPMVIARAEAFELTGYESAQQLTDNKAFMQRMEHIRLQAGAAMGLGDVSESVVPKFGLLAPARDGGSVSARYFMPWSCHPTMAVTGAHCIASCLLTPGSVAQGLYNGNSKSPASIVLEHASGKIDVLLDYRIENGQFTPLSAGIIRTARKLADGNVYVPASVWSTST